MLYKETVSPFTLELLKTLIDDQLLADFFLVGGTALSLQIGHRKSIDLDFFSLADFDHYLLMTELEEKYHFQSDLMFKSLSSI